MKTDTVIFYHHPYSRARVVHWMLEETGAPYEIKLQDFQRGDLEKPEFLAINPMGRIPTIQHRGVTVTETPAICAYLADAFPKAQLAPPIDSPLRGTYFRWLFFAVACVEPVVMDRKSPRTTPPADLAIGYGPYEETMGVFQKALEPGPFILGNAFSAADVYVASLLDWFLMTKAIETNATFDRYLAACHARKGYQSAMQQAEGLLKQLGTKPA
jgi:glutathione S-transferase